MARRTLSNYNNITRMKFSLVGLVWIFTLMVSAQESQEPVSGARLVMVEDNFDFGDINEGDRVEHTFEFENSGDQPLIFSNVLTTCGCTASNWPREPIAPGEMSAVTVTFNSAGKPGIQKKVITILSNAINNRERIYITTNVIPKGMSEPN